MVGSSFLEEICKEFTDGPDPFDSEATLLGEDVRMLFPETLDVQMYGLDNVAALQVGHHIVTSGLRSPTVILQLFTFALTGSCL